MIRAAVCAVALTACTADAPAPYLWNLPPGFVEPVVPPDNPMSVAKVELGRRLFFEPRLSINGTTACATCHDQRLGFADGKVVPTGATGDRVARNSPQLQNVAYASTYTWTNPVLTSLEAQVVVPLYGDAPLEMGLGRDEAGIMARLSADPVYADAFAEAFPDDDQPVGRAGVIRALASFVRSMISADAPYDRFAYGGDPDALSPAAQRGFDLFTSERLECYHCHAVNANFTAAFRVAGQAQVALAFENDGLYNVGGTGAYPADNRGLIEFTQRPEDEGRFRVPSLRNVAITAPYMHDGSVATLDDVIDMYARGGRLIESGPLAGDGRANPNKSVFVRGFTLTAEERADLRAFLDSLTDPTFLAAPQFAAP